MDVDQFTIEYQKKVDEKIALHRDMLYNEDETQKLLRRMGCEKPNVVSVAKVEAQEILVAGQAELDNDKTYQATKKRMRAGNSLNAEWGIESNLTPKITASQADTVPAANAADSTVETTVEA